MTIIVKFMITRRNKFQNLFSSIVDFFLEKLLGTYNVVNVDPSELLCTIGIVIC